MNISRRGMLLVLSSPSGAGKTTLSRRLLASDKDITMSVSVTTRPPRPGEVEGKDYYFISTEKFEEMRKADELLESATVFGNGYGTPRAPVEAWLKQGRDVLFDIDWQGTQQIQSKMEKDLVRIFILPPSAEALHDRLLQRNQDLKSVIAKRMAEASSEISHYAEYDYVLINYDIDRCEAEIRAIVDAERLKRQRLEGLADFVNELRRNL